MDLIDDNNKGDNSNNNYKSFFARSVAVNSQQQYKQSELSLDQEPEKPSRAAAEPNLLLLQRDSKNPGKLPIISTEFEGAVRLRKNSSCKNFLEENRYLATSRRKSICSGRIVDLPVENIVNQSKVETLQWQLKEIEKSREMYKAVMKQVVIFLEKAHNSLELISKKVTTKKPSVSRSRSEHEIIVLDNNNDTVTTNGSDSPRSLFINDSWTTATRNNKNATIGPEEIPPDKLAQEAFRLLRTAQSLLNTQEPKLTPSHQHHQSSNEEDIEFLEQLAKEFPSPSQTKPSRTTSFSLSPKLLLPENEITTTTSCSSNSSTKQLLSMTFNRKLSLQLNESRRKIDSTTVRRNTTTTVAVVDYNNMNNNNNNNNQLDLDKFNINNNNIPAISNGGCGGSISSAEDESGFSSMNSFQDVGLPLCNSTILCEDVKSILHRNILHNNNIDYLNSTLDTCSESSKLLQSTSTTSTTRMKKLQHQHHDNNDDQGKLWQKSSSSGNNNNSHNTPVIPHHHHERWASAPVDTSKSKYSMKVLWV